MMDTLARKVAARAVNDADRQIALRVAARFSANFGKEAPDKEKRPEQGQEDRPPEAITTAP